MNDDRPESDRQSTDASERRDEESTETRGASLVPGSPPLMIGQVHGRCRALKSTWPESVLERATAVYKSKRLCSPQA